MTVRKHYRRGTAGRRRERREPEAIPICWLGGMRDIRHSLRSRLMVSNALVGMHARCVLSPRLLSLAPILSTVPPVLHSVVASVVHLAGDVSPLLSHGEDKFLDLLAFLLCDGLMIEIRFEVLVPSLTALLRRARYKNLSDRNPLPRALLLHK